MTGRLFFRLPIRLITPVVPASVSQRASKPSLPQPLDFLAPRFTRDRSNSLTKVSQSVRLSVSVCAFVRSLVRPSTLLSVRPSTLLSVRPSTLLSVRPSIRLLVCPSVHTAVRTSVHPFLGLSVRFSSIIKDFLQRRSFCQTKTWPKYLSRHRCLRPSSPLE